MAEASTLLAVEGLHCGACVSRVEQLLASQHVAGEVDLATRALNVRLAPDDPLLSGLCRAMAAAGFPVRRLTEAADSDASPASRRL